jgi:hypothetical protein
MQVEVPCCNTSRTGCGGCEGRRSLVPCLQRGACNETCWSSCLQSEGVQALQHVCAAAFSRR